MSTGLLHYQTGSFQAVPSRKPLPQHDGTSRLQSMTHVVNDPYINHQQRPHPAILEARPPQRTSSMASSSILAPSNAALFPQQSSASSRSISNPTVAMAHPHPASPARRTLSNATTSTTSTGGGPPVRMNSGSSSLLQRSTSSRSGNSPTSYVALMRKQKATVWCDRAQQEDPRVLAQQRAAKQRAAMEVSSTSYSARATPTTSSSITGGVRSKIRHHGAPKAQQYAPAAHPTSGVPMRLSAREVDEGDSDDEANYAAGAHHRSGSGRSSLGSTYRTTSNLPYPGTPPMSGTGASERTATGTHSWTSSPTTTTTTGQPDPPQRSRADTGSTARGSTSGADEPTPVPEHYQRADYFAPRALGSPAASPPQRRADERGHGYGYGYGGADADGEHGFGGVGALPQRAGGRVGELRTGDLDLVDLRRRGSVDERSLTMTMNGFGRLFVANPDVED